jgi:hypothetical protein
MQHYIRGQAHTMLPIKRLDNIQHCMAEIENDKVPGDCIETGVWRGGATIFMRAFLKVHGVENRRVWVADSFEGLPVPDVTRFPLEAKAHSSKTMVEEYKHFAVSVDDVKDNFRRYGLLDDQVVFLKGWFKDTLPHAPIESLSLMRLDGDYYESTMDGLVNLYPKLASGGFVVIDDYGEDMWTYCRKAVDDFRAAHGITDPLVKVDSKCYFWRRS